MSKFKVLEFETILKVYKMEAGDKNEAIKKIKMGDLTTRVLACCGKDERIRRWYETEDLSLKRRLASGKKIQTPLSNEFNKERGSLSSFRLQLLFGTKERAN